MRGGERGREGGGEGRDSDVVDSQRRRNYFIARGAAASAKAGKSSTPHCAGTSVPTLGARTGSGKTVLVELASAWGDLE